MLPGDFNSPESREAYRRLIAEWTANDRHLLGASALISVVEVLEKFAAFADTHYIDADGLPTGEVENFGHAARPRRATRSRTSSRCGKGRRG